MFVVNIMPNNTNANVSMAYKTEGRAKETYERLLKTAAELVWTQADDDFGNTVMIDGKSISHVVMIDVAKSQWREWEINQCVERTRALLGKRPAILASA